MLHRASERCWSDKGGARRAGGDERRSCGAEGLSFEAVIMLIETALWAHGEDLDHIHCLLFNLAHQKGCVLPTYLSFLPFLSAHGHKSRSSPFAPDVLALPKPSGIALPGFREILCRLTCHFFMVLTLDLKAPPDLLSRTRMEDL